MAKDKKKPCKNCEGRGAAQGRRQESKVPALRRHGQAVLVPAIPRFVFALVAVAALAHPARAQSAFEPHTVAYSICVTNEIKQLALATPEIAKDTIIGRAFVFCREEELEGKKLLAERGLDGAAIEERFAQVKRFLRQTAPDDIERFRVHRIPR
jgi:hypothetical protein